jgi:hypothetical protein
LLNFYGGGQKPKLDIKEWSKENDSEGSWTKVIESNSDANRKRVNI